MSRRWMYKVVEVKPQLLGLKPANVESALATLGQQGWELVQAVPHGLGVWLYLRKEA